MKDIRTFEKNDKLEVCELSLGKKFDAMQSYNQIYNKENEFKV